LGSFFSKKKEKKGKVCISVIGLGDFKVKPNVENLR
jgi:hypothetical protein